MMSYYVRCRVIDGREGWYSLLVRFEEKKEKIYSDLTKDYDALADLARRINRGRVSGLHVEDIIEDFLG
jgi:hypothetical protein